MKLHGDNTAHKKQPRLLALAMLLLFALLTGCGGGGGNNTQDDNDDTGQNPSQSHTVISGRA